MAAMSTTEVHVLLGGELHGDARAERMTHRTILSGEGG
jgi:hypothetical protein